MHTDPRPLPLFIKAPGVQSVWSDNVIDARAFIARTRFHKPLKNRRIRVVLYSHDTMGLGHIRRNLLLAQGLSELRLSIDILLITGARESINFSLPKNVDLVVLPALHKSNDGSYRARNLGVELNDLTALRSHIVFSTIKSFQPDLVIVDNVPRGVNGELDQALQYIREHGAIRCVLGLRDIQDEAEKVIRDWQKQQHLETIRNFYHSIWVYGDARVYDPGKEYRLPKEITDKMQYTGYLDRRIPLRDNSKTDRIPECVVKPFGLCLVGGGQDGAALATAFASATYPAGMAAVIIAGPHMDCASMATLRGLASERPQLKILNFVAEPEGLLRDAEFIVCMGGYNTVCEVISLGKPALIVPRIIPRREQIIRAERLQSLGITDMMHPHDLSAKSLSHWIASLPDHHMTSAHDLVDMNGMQRFPQYFLDQIRQLENPPEHELSYVEL